MTRGKVRNGPRPYSEHNSQNKELLISIWEGLPDIETIQDFLDFLRTRLCAEALDVLVVATVFFSEKKTKENGKRDGKKIYEHIRLGFGERLTPRHKINLDIVMALKTFITRLVMGNTENEYLRDELQHRRFHAHALALDVLNLLSELIQVGSNPPKLPYYLR